MTGRAASPPGSREPDPQAVPALPGFDPSRWDDSRFSRLLRELCAEQADDEYALPYRACINALAEAIEDLCVQYAPKTSYNKAAAIFTGGLSTLEDAFDLLGWHDPHRVPDCTCDEPGCWKWIQAGIPTPSGYRHVCSEHALALRVSDGSPEGEKPQALNAQHDSAVAEGETPNA